MFVWNRGFTRLVIVIGLEAVGIGPGTAVFVARATHRAYTATQCAYSAASPSCARTFANAASGWLVQMMMMMRWAVMVPTG